MTSFTPPDSDLTGPGLPYKAVLAITDHPGALNARIRLRLQRQEPDLSGAELRAENRIASTGKPGAHTIEIGVDVGQMAPGEYAGELTLELDGANQSWPIRFFRVSGQKKTGIPFGIYAVPYPADTAGMDETLALIRQTGIDLLCMHMNGLAQDRAFLDRAARAGLSFCPSSNMNRRADGSAVEWADESRIRFAPGAPSLDKAPACFNRPEVRQQAAGAFAEMVHQYRSHPAFSGLAYYGDDLFMHPQNMMGKSWISCYCPRCRADFKNQNGYEPPFSTEGGRGVVPASDPWLAWMQYRCRDVFGGFIDSLMTAKDAVDPSVRLGLCHGWPDNPFTSVATGIYTPLSQKSTDVVSSYAYPFLRAPAADFICHYEFGKMNNRSKEVWMLGLFLSDSVLTPDWEITQNYWNMLAAGYSFIAFFSWWNYVGDMNNPSEERREQTRHALSVLARCGAHKDWIFPAARHWQLPPARVAALYSFTTEAFDIQPHNQNHRHMKELCRFYRLALAKSISPNLVCEEEVRAGFLDRYDALCLHDVRALPDDVHAKIQAFADSGKLVLVDPDYLYADPWHPNMQVSVRGAIEMTPESMAQVLADRFPAPFSVSNPDVTTRRFTSGETDCYVFVNNFPDRYHGMSYWYGDMKKENDKRAAFVRSEPIEARVLFTGEKRFLFDLSTGDRVGDTTAPLALNLEPAWGRVVMALPCESANLSVDVPASVRQGEKALFRLRMLTPAGARITAAFVARITVVSPSGRTNLFGGHVDLKEGQADFVLPVGCNDEIGTWRLAFEGGFPRKTIPSTLDVCEGESPVLDMRSVFASGVFSRGKA